MFFSKNRNYARSNRIKSVKFYISKRAVKISRAILNSDLAKRRQRLSNLLCRELCELADVDSVSVLVSDTNQTHKKSKGKLVYKQYGFYRPDKKEIYISNRTAVRSQILAPKTFLNTLVHEWIHHYDTHKLRLDSIHTKGFYLRVKSLEDGLRQDII